MTTMAGERKRYRNPVTNRIEYIADPQVADILGLELWDGPTQEIEKDKVTGIEVAVFVGEADAPDDDAAAATALLDALAAEQAADAATSQDSPEVATATQEAHKPAGTPAAGDKK